MRKLALWVFLASMALPAFAAKRVTVNQLAQALTAAQGKPDAEVAWQLSGMELTERLSAAQFSHLKAGLPGEKAQQALIALADASVFLDPPAAEIPATAAPDFAAQRRIIGLVVKYVSKTIPQLPNLFATRETTHFADTPQGHIMGGATATGFVPLHAQSTTSATVFYRDGREVVGNDAEGAKPAPREAGLSTWGEFGPILATVLLDAAQSKLAWSHWEQGSSEPVAVFTYAVPKEKSHYEVDYCCVPDSEGRLHVFHRLAGYHGELTVDSSTGIILRLKLQAEMKADDPVAEAGMVVEYSPVEIGGKSYICPVRSIALSRAQSETQDKDIVVQSGPRAGGTAAMSVVHTTSLTPGPEQTLLNEAVFAEYHVFRAEIHVVQADEASTAPALPPLGASADAGNASAFPAASTPSGAESRLPASSAGTSASVPSPATEAVSTPAPAPSPAPEPEISVAAATGLPDAPSNPPAFPRGTGFTLKTTARLVDAGVVAYDKKGHPVTDLKPGDFEIYDNGRKQQVRFFSQAGNTAPEQPAALQGQTAAAPDQPTFSNHRATASAARDSNGSVTILLIDAGNVAFGDLTYARAEMLRFLKTLSAGEPVGLYVMKRYGFEVLMEPVTDHAVLAARLTKWMPSAQDLAQAQDEERRNRQQMEMVHSVPDLEHVNGNSVDAPDKVDPGVPGSANPVDAQLQELGSNPGRNALSILAGVARHLAALPGHKNLVWVSSDNVLADWSDKAVSVDKGSKFIDAFALRAQEAMNDAHVSVYPLDASQLEAGGTTADIGTRNVLVVGRSDRDQAYAGLGDASPGMKPGRDTARMQQDTHPIQGTFRELAAATGGRALRRAGDIGAELDGIVADGRAAYLLSFTPDQPADDKYHLLTVKLTGRRDVTLRYRTGYQYSKEPASLKERFRRAIWQPADATEIALSASPDAGRAALKLNVAAGDLALAQQGDLWTDKLDIFLVQRDDAGLHAQVTGQTMGLRLKPATYERLLREGIPFDQTAELKPETGSVRILVVDENSGRMGSITVPAAAMGRKW